jgi:polyphenol oxidase
MSRGDRSVPRERAIDPFENRSVLLPADWPVPAGVHACTTLRRGHDVGASLAPFDRFNLGAHCGDDAASVARNRADLLTIAQLPAAPRWLRQVHGIEVAQLDSLPSAALDAGGESHPLADAAVSAQRGVVLAILTADCLPVLLCSDDGGMIGAAHAGWRGLAAGVLEATVAGMQRPAASLSAWLGPAAGPDAYEIGEEVRAAFVDRSPHAERAFTPTRAGHWRIDLFELARQRLASVGVARVYGGGVCTISDAARFYSHRRDGRSGRMATLLWREPLPA